MNLKKIGEYRAQAQQQQSTPDELSAEIFFGRGVRDDSFKEFFISKISQAKQSISIAMYSIEDRDIISLLQEKKNQGLQVSIIVPLRKEAQHSIAFALTDIELLELGIPAQGDQEYQETPIGFMHHKFILIDEETDQAELILSSSNLTKSQFLYDPGFALVTQDADIIKGFRQEFSRLKKTQLGLKKLRTGTYQPFSLVKGFSQGEAELWFGPGYLENSVKTRMLEEINKATSSVKVLGWVITDKEIWNLLVQKSRAGVDVSIIIDDHFLWNESTPLDIREIENNPKFKIASDSFMNIILENEGLLGSTISDNFNSFLHHHTLLVDDKILFMGTNNWSRGGFYLNDEATVVTSVQPIVQSYVNEWNRLKKQLVGDDTLVVSYDSKSSTITIVDLPQGAEKILVYREESNPLWMGVICARNSSPVRTINISRDCASARTRVFALTGDGNLLASTYLQMP